MKTNIQAEELFRICKKCKLEKEISCFKKQKLGKNGIAGSCRDCGNTAELKRIRRKKILQREDRTITFDKDSKTWVCCGTLCKNMHSISAHWSKIDCGNKFYLGELLKDFYFKDKLTQNQIKDIFGTTVATINHWFAFFEIKVRKGRTPWNKGKKGSIPWNKGLKAADDCRIRAYGLNGAKTKRLKMKSVVKLNDLVRGLPEYKLWREAIFVRDGYKSILSAIGGPLEVHHKYPLDRLLSDLSFKDWRCSSSSVFDVISSLKEYDPLWDINNGVTLLKTEHKMLHSRNIKIGTAVITGIQGQDASYMAEDLLAMGFEVIGIARRKSSPGDFNQNLKSILNDKNFKIEYGDICDISFINYLMQSYQPEYYLNFAAASHVAQSFIEPLETLKVNGTAPLLALEAIRRNSKDTRFLQCNTSEMYGGINCPPTGYTEESPFYPRSPYACAKAFSHYSTVNAREAYGTYAVSSILFNHGSPRRGHDFLERKVTRTLAAIKLGQEKDITLGNLEAYRDLGHSKDYVRAQWLMLQQEKPVDYVIATGETHQIKEILETVAEIAEIKDIYKYVKFDEKFMRPSEVPYLLGDSTKARKELGWMPTYTFQSLLEEMYRNDYNQLRK